MNLEEITFDRGQFTFYRSFWESAKELDDAERLAFYDAIIGYGLNGDCGALSGARLAMFLLVKPILDNGRKKAANGKQGGSTTEANGKQTASKKKNKGENKREKKNKKENKNNMLTPTPFDAFWDAYPRKSGKGKARESFEKVKVPLETLLTAIDRQKKSRDWQKDDGAYIPYPATWLNQSRWEDELPEATPKPNEIHGATGIGAAEVEAIQKLMREPMEELYGRD